MVNAKTKWHEKYLRRLSFNRPARRWLTCFILLTTMSHSLLAQRAPYAFPARSSAPLPDSNLRITLDGRMIMDMGNYDVVLSGPLNSPLSDIDAVDTPTPQVIMKGSTGIRWDGGTYFDHPAHHHELVTRYYYGNRVVGRGDERYPPLRQQATWGYQGVPQYKKAKLGSIPLLDGRPIGEFGPNTGIDFKGTSTSSDLTPPFTETGALPPICLEYPYAIQCQPPWDQTKVHKPIIESTELSDSSLLHMADEPDRPRSPRVPAKPKARPIVILNLDADAFSYTLPSSGSKEPITIPGGEKHELNEGQVILIRFDSQGMGTKTYRLRSGNTYQIRKNQSDVWELHRQTTPAVAKNGPS